MKSPRAAVILRMAAAALDRAADRCQPEPAPPAMERPESYADFCEKLRLEREAEIERECQEMRPTRFSRKLKSVGK